MFDLTRSYFNDAKERPLIDGASVTEEGILLAYASDGAGGVGVQPCVAASVNIAGFAITDALKVVTETVVEQVTVPAAGGAVNLSHTNLVAASSRAYASTTGELTEEATGTPAAGEYYLADTTGIITFNVAQAGETVLVYYRYNLTLQDSLNKYHERSINNRAQDYFSSLSVGCLEGEIFTSMYDTSVAYTILADIYPAAGGLVSATNGGGSVIGYVSQVPGVNDALLGVKFTIPNS